MKILNQKFQPKSMALWIINEILQLFFWVEEGSLMRMTSCYSITTPSGPTTLILFFPSTQVETMFLSKRRGRIFFFSRRNRPIFKSHSEKMVIIFQSHFCVFFGLKSSLRIYVRLRVLVLCSSISSHSKKHLWGRSTWDVQIFSHGQLVKIKNTSAKATGCEGTHKSHTCCISNLL